MPENDGNTAQPANQASASTNVAPSGTGSYSVSTGSTDGSTNWEAAYKTLQRNHGALADKYKSLEAQAAELNTNYTTQASQLKTLEETLKQREDAYAELQRVKAELEGKATELEGKLDRQNLILSEFPELVEFETKGLLPSAENPDDLREKLETFKTTLGQIRSNAIDEKLEGASPEPVQGATENEGAAPSITVDEAWNKVISLAGRDQEAYEKAYQEYLDILDAQESKE